MGAELHESTHLEIRPGYSVTLTVNNFPLLPMFELLLAPGGSRPYSPFPTLD